MFHHNSSSERGQSMVLIAMLMVVLIGLSALVLDGGLGFAKRRQAQNAADAAALAGADALCDNDAGTNPRNIAEEYVISNGGNQPAYEDIIIGDREVTVTAFVSHPTFFAGIFGTDEITASATATAGCFAPCSLTGILPVAWACQPPAGGTVTDSCAVDYGTMSTPGPLYIIMDSEKTSGDVYCQDPPNSGLPSGTLDCDLDDDGYDDLMLGGDRSWLDLSGGGGGASELSNWITNGFPHPIYPHTWFAGQSGVATSIYHTAEERVGDIVFLPVFTAFCEGLPASVCPALYHPEDTTVVSPSASQLYFHVLTFSPFRITCVSASAGEHCPGKDYARSVNPSIKANTKSIEGYFIEDYVGSGACDGPYAGAYTIYLK
jgi:hypothetical protein